MLIGLRRTEVNRIRIILTAGKTKKNPTIN